MELIKNNSDILKNLQALKLYSESENEEEKKFYKSLIKRGTCFLIYKEDGMIKYAPSRFIGYKNNSIKAHIHNNERDGRVTNKKIIDILTQKPVVILNAEYGYLAFCKRLRIHPQPFGAFGAPRKYWFLRTSIEKELENRFNNIEKEKFDEEEINEDRSNTSKDALIKARKGQGKFRKELIRLWKCCPITKCDVVKILKASHIRPWRYSSNRERLDKYNGILLSPTYDSLFDLGLISFSEKGNIIISHKLSMSNREYLNLDINSIIQFEKDNLSYLKFHRDNIFKK